MSMTTKREHYVAAMLLRRFAVAPGEERPQIWCLEKESGRSYRTNIINQAVISRDTTLKDLPGVPPCW